MNYRQTGTLTLRTRVGEITIQCSRGYSKSQQRRGSPVSDDNIHLMSQRMGAAAAAIKSPTPHAVKREAVSLVIMMDSWMVRRGGRIGGGKSAVIFRLESRMAIVAGVVEG